MAHTNQAAENGAENSVSATFMNQSSAKLERYEMVIYSRLKQLKLNKDQFIQKRRKFYLYTRS